MPGSFNADFNADFDRNITIISDGWLTIEDVLNWETVWDTLVSYSEGDVVIHQSGDLIHAFVSKADHNVGNTPPTSYQWWTRLIQVRVDK